MRRLSLPSSSLSPPLLSSPPLPPTPRHHAAVVSAPLSPPLNQWRARARSPSTSVPPRGHGWGEGEEPPRHPYHYPQPPQEQEQMQHSTHHHARHLGPAPGEGAPGPRPRQSQIEALGGRGGADAPVGCRPIFDSACAQGGGGGPPSYGLTLPSQLRDQARGLSPFVFPVLTPALFFSCPPSSAPRHTMCLASARRDRRIRSE